MFALMVSLLSWASLTSAHGAAAKKLPRVRATRAKLRGRAFYAPVRGSSKRVKLTLRPRLQRKARELLRASRAHEGAIVMTDIRSGKVLVWASLGGRRDYVSRPYAPSASVFKVVTAAALLESRKVLPTTRQCYTGGEKKIMPGDLHDDITRDDRCAPFKIALGHSINLVIARLALKHLKPDDIYDMAEGVGIGAPVPIDVKVPTSDLRIPKSRLGFARASAGFWNGHLSPLSAAFMMQTIANKGKVRPLRLLADTKSPGFTGRAMQRQTAVWLRRMLEVTTRSGTSKTAFRLEDGSKAFPRRRVAGKTGTLIGGRPRRMYSWFAGFAPARRPRVAIAVLLGNDVRWWTKANVVARDMLLGYFDPKGNRKEAAHKRYLEKKRRRARRR